MIAIKREGILLDKTNLEFENEGVLNPAAIRTGDNVHLFYRAVRQGNFSTIGYCRLDGPLNVAERWDRPFMVPETDYELHGIEDPRIVKIDDLYYMTYTAYDGKNALGALATSSDLKHFDRKGIIVSPFTYSEFVTHAESARKVNEDYYHNQRFYSKIADPDKKVLLWDKNLVFFPRRINGKLVFLHRIRPGIQIVSTYSINDLTLEFWQDYFHHFEDHIIMDPHYDHESCYLGSGCPPIETEYGWLLIYHGARLSEKGVAYSACAAALLDLENPGKVIARLPYALFSPETEWEINGDVNNVVFPTGTALFGDTLYIYYGAADERIACVSLKFSALVAELFTNTVRYERKNV